MYESLIRLTIISSQPGCCGFGNAAIVHDAEQGRPGSGYAHRQRTHPEQGLTGIQETGQQALTVRLSNQVSDSFRRCPGVSDV